MADLVVLPSAVHGTETNIATNIDVDDRSSGLRVQVNVTAISGAGATLTPFVEDSVDGGATWNVIDTIPPITTVSRVVRNIAAPYGSLVRLRHSVSGTSPSITFAVHAYDQVGR